MRAPPRVDGPTAASVRPRPASASGGLPGFRSESAAARVTVAIAFPADAAGRRLRAGAVGDADGFDLWATSPRLAAEPLPSLLLGLALAGKGAEPVGIA